MKRRDPDVIQVGVEKSRLRRDLSTLLRAIPLEQSLASGRKACSWLRAWDGFANVLQVVAYSLLQGEVDPGPICELAHTTGKRVLLPRIVNDDLEFAMAFVNDELVAGRYGILEPPLHRAAQRIDSRAVVLVPGLAFDRFGGRLGRGAGYYDRALGAARELTDRTIFIGVGFPQQMIDRVPMTSFDVRMDALLTEEALHWVGESGGHERK